MSLTSNLPLLTSANWYQWEQLALNSISVYGHAGRAIQTNQPYTATEPCKPMRFFYLEEVQNPGNRNPTVFKTLERCN